MSRVTGDEQVKTRRHEALVRDFGEWAQFRGFRGSTSEHPKGLVLRNVHGEWLIEARIIRKGNATDGVRQALA